MGFIKKSNAQLFLIVNAFLWGSSYVWSKMLLDYLPRFSILFLCSLGGLIATVLLFYRRIKTISMDSLFPSIITSLFSVISNIFFMFALQYTSSSNTAFIVQLSVIITPVIMAVLDRKVPEKKIVISAVTAAAGLFMLTCDFETFRLNIGDLLALGNALFFSIFLTSQKLFSKKVHPIHFTFVHYSTNTLVFFIMAAFFELRFINILALKDNLFLLLISASIIISTATVLLQSAAIRFVRPEKATLIYTLEPVAALALATVIIGERLKGIIPIIGCGVIFLSVIYSICKTKTEKTSLGMEVSAKPALE